MTIFIWIQIDFSTDKNTTDKNTTNLINNDGNTTNKIITEKNNNDQYLLWLRLFLKWFLES